MVVPAFNCGIRCGFCGEELTHGHLQSTHQCRVHRNAYRRHLESTHPCRVRRDAYRSIITVGNFGEGFNLRIDDYVEEHQI